MDLQKPIGKSGIENWEKGLFIIYNFNLLNKTNCIWTKFLI